MFAKISVIVPCYNYERYIEKCLMSIVLQHRNFNVEILVGNDNSTDNSLKIVNRFARYYESDNLKFKIYSHNTNLGEISNTKFLLENCEGEYIAYLDADDYWIDPNKLKRQIEFLDNNKDYSICVTGYIELLNDIDYIPSVDFSNWLCPVDVNRLNAESLTSVNIVGSSSSRLFRNYKDLVKDYFYEFPYSDWVINFELALKGKIGYLDFPSYVYRIHDNSLSKKDYQTENPEELYKKRVNILKSELDKHINN
jgi:glycosyltransferase involved in cell wall biosynthesis